MKKKIIYSIPLLFIIFLACHSSQSISDIKAVAYSDDNKIDIRPIYVNERSFQEKQTSIVLPGKEEDLKTQDFLKNNSLLSFNIPYLDMSTPSTENSDLKNTNSESLSKSNKDKRSTKSNIKTTVSKHYEIDQSDTTKNSSTNLQQAIPDNSTDFQNKTTENTKSEDTEGHVFQVYLSDDSIYSFTTNFDNSVRHQLDSIESLQNRNQFAEIQQFIKNVTTKKTHLVDVVLFGLFSIILISSVYFLMKKIR